MKLDGVPEHKRNTAAETPAPIIDRSASIKGLLTTFDNSRGPLSIRLNAAYGTGKTTFLDQLQKTADKDKFIIIYYNAWEEEISLDARSSLCLKLLSEIQNLNTEENFQSSIFKYQKAILPFIASAGTAVISRVIFRDHEALENIINAVKPEQEIRKLMDEKFAELQQNSSTIDAVKSSLKSLLDILSGKKIILLIDELDRCRPDFAMEVLETVKHFFSIEKVFALVGVDENILHSIIKKRYGDTIDCEGYLLRHFSSEMQFSEFSYQQYCMDKCKQFGISSDFYDNVIFICHSYGLKLRAINTFISFLSSVYNSKSKENAQDFGFFILIYGIKMFDRQLFDCCLNNTRGEYFDKKMKYLRLMTNNKLVPFQTLLFLIKTSESDYNILAKEYNCKTYPDNDRYRLRNAQSGLHYYSSIVSGFYDFSNAQ